MLSGNAERIYHSLMYTHTFRSLRSQKECSHPANQNLSFAIPPII